MASTPETGRGDRAQAGVTDELVACGQLFGRPRRAVRALLATLVAVVALAMPVAAGANDSSGYDGYCPRELVGPDGQVDPDCYTGAAWRS